MTSPFLRLALAGTVLAILGGCSSTEYLGTRATGSLLPIEDWSSVPRRKEARASRVSYAHEVRFAAGDATLTGDEGRRLDDFLHRLGAGYGDRLSVVGGSGRRARTVTAFLSSRRLPAAVRPGRGDKINVVVERYVATLPGCPDWSGEPGNNFNNTAHGNWGCATASNLGRMVADPGHLVAGTALAPIDAEYGVLAIQRYRRGETRPLNVDGGSTVELPISTAGSGS